MVYWIIKIMSTTLILIVDWWKSRFKSIKRTYHYVAWLFFSRRLQTKDNHLVVRLEKESVTNSAIPGLVLNTPWSRIGHMIDWLVTVLLWLSENETAYFTKVGPPTSLRSEKPCNKIGLFMINSYFCSCRILLKVMVITSKNRIFKGKINGILNNKIYEKNFHFNNRLM